MAVQDPVRVRATVVRIIDRGDTTTVIGPKLSRRFEGDSAQLLRAVLEIHERPVSRSELFVALAARSDHDVPQPPVDELLALLVEDGVLVAPRDPAPASFAPLRRVVLGISGAIAAVDAPSVIRGLQAIGCEVRVALTQSARRFVSTAALEALTHHAVWRGMWQRDALVPVPHINLAEWAELVVVSPASATTLARIATGDCSDLVAAIVCATRAPVVLAPSMNDAMYGSPAVQHNLETLREHGRWLVHPAFGIEVADRPTDRRSMLGPAPPAAALLDIVQHVIGEIAPRPRLPQNAREWERLWSTTPAEQLPWHADEVAGPLAAALDAFTQPQRLLDLGTGAGTAAIAASRRGFRVTATDIAPSALGRARERAGALPIQFVLDDVTASHLDGTFEVAIDCGLLHCLPRSAWTAYASVVTTRIPIGGSLLLVAHESTAMATEPVTREDLASLLPSFELISAVPTALSRSAANLFELQRRG